MTKVYNDEEVQEFLESKGYEFTDGDNNFFKETANEFFEPLDRGWIKREEDRDETLVKMIAPQWAWDIIFDAIRADIVANEDQVLTDDLQEAEEAVELLDK